MSIKNYINPQLLEKANIYKLNNKFLKNKPYKHIQIKNFLEPKVADKLLKEIKKETFKEKESDLFQFKQTDDLYFSKNSTIKQFNSKLLTWPFFSLISQITINKKFKGVLDMSATLYEKTSFLLPHDDKIENRKIAYLLYLSKNFKEKDGGSFALYNSKNNSPTTISKLYPPEFNSLLLFEVSKNSFHEVTENISNKKRYTIGGWLG